MEPRLPLAAIAWDGGGGNNSWDDPLNWSTDTVPGNADQVSIVLDGDYTVELKSEVAVDQLVIGGSSGRQFLDVGDQTLTIVTSATIAPRGGMLLFHGTVAGNGVLTNQGLIDSRGTSSVQHLANEAGSQLRIVGVNSFTNGASTKLTVANGFTNVGLIELTDVDLGGQNFPTTSLSVAAGTLTNAAEGTIRLVAGSAFGAARTLDATLHNQGTVEAQTSSVIENANRNLRSDQGIINVAENETLTVREGMTELGTGTQLTGAGIVDLSGTATLALLTDLVLPAAGSQLSLSGSVTITGPGSLTNQQPTWELRGETVEANLRNEGGILARGTTTIANLETTTDSTLRVQGVHSFSIGANARVTIRNGFTNRGLLELSYIEHFGQNFPSTTLTVSEGTLTNATTGIIRGLDGGRFELKRTIVATIDNQGLIDIQNDTTVNNDNKTFRSMNGTMQVAASEQLEIDGGTTVLGSGTAFDGAGVVNLTGTHTLKLESDLLLTATGSQLALGGSVTVNGPGGLTNRQPTLELRGETVEADLRNEGGILARGTTTIASLVTTSDSTLRVQGVHSFSIGANAHLTISNGFTNLGLIELTDVDFGGQNFPNETLVVTNGVLVNDAAGRIRFAAGDGVSSKRRLDAQIDNQGTLEVLSDKPAEFLQDFEQSSGITRLEDARLFYLGESIISGGDLTGTGRIGGHVTINGGRVTPGNPLGQLEFDNDLSGPTSGMVGTLLVQIGGTTAVAEYDRIRMRSGTANLGGTLRVELLNDFVPEIGDSFTVMIGETSGSFSTLELPDLPDGRQWNLASGSLTLEVIATPATRRVWDAGGDGISWFDPLNWSDDVLPGESDDVVIESASAPTTILFADAEATVKSISSEQPLQLSSGRLEVLGAWDARRDVLIEDAEVVVATESSFDDELQLNGEGELKIPSGEVAASNLVWQGGTISGPGELHLTGGQIEAGGGKLLQNGTLINFGEFRWLGGNLQASGEATFENRGTFFLSGVDPGGSLLSSDTPSSSSELINSGSLLINESPLITLGGRLTSTGSITIPPNTVLAVPGGVTQTVGSLTLASPTSSLISNVALDGGTLAATGLISGNVTNAAELELIGPLTIAGDYTQSGKLISKLNTEMTHRLTIGGAVQLGGDLEVVTDYRGDLSRPGPQKHEVLTYEKLQQEVTAFATYTNLPSSFSPKPGEGDFELWAFPLETSIIEGLQAVVMHADQWTEDLQPVISFPALIIGEVTDQLVAVLDLAVDNLETVLNQAISSILGLIESAGSAPNAVASSGNATAESLEDVLEQSFSLICLGSGSDRIAGCDEQEHLRMRVEVSGSGQPANTSLSFIIDGVAGNLEFAEPARTSATAQMHLEFGVDEVGFFVSDNSVSSIQMGLEGAGELLNDLRRSDLVQDRADSQVTVVSGSERRQSVPSRRPPDFGDAGRDVFDTIHKGAASVGLGFQPLSQLQLSAAKVFDIDSEERPENPVLLTERTLTGTFGLGGEQVPLTGRFVADPLPAATTASTHWVLEGHQEWAPGSLAKEVSADVAIVLSPDELTGELDGKVILAAPEAFQPLADLKIRGTLNLDASIQRPDLTGVLQMFGGAWTALAESRVVFNDVAGEPNDIMIEFLSASHAVAGILSQERWSFFGEIADVLQVGQHRTELSLNWLYGHSEEFPRNVVGELVFSEGEVGDLGTLTLTAILDDPQATLQLTLAGELNLFGFEFQPGNDPQKNFVILTWGASQGAGASSSLLQAQVEMQKQFAFDREQSVALTVATTGITVQASDEMKQTLSGLSVDLQNGFQATVEAGENGASVVWGEVESNLLLTVDSIENALINEWVVTSLVLDVIDTMTGSINIAKQAVAAVVSLQISATLGIIEIVVAIVDPFHIADYVISGAIELTANSETAAFLIDGTMALPGLGAALVQGSLDRKGYGLLNVSPSGLNPGGFFLGPTDSTLVLGGQFQLERKQELVCSQTSNTPFGKVCTGKPVLQDSTQFLVLSPTLSWNGLTIVLAAGPHRILADGAFELPIVPQVLNLVPPSTQPGLQSQALAMAANSGTESNGMFLELLLGGVLRRISSGEISLSFPDLAQTPLPEAPSMLHVPGFVPIPIPPFEIVQTSGDFLHELPLSTLTTGLFEIVGKVFLERVQGNFQVAVRGTPGLTPDGKPFTQLPQLRMGELLEDATPLNTVAGINLAEFVIGADGSFQTEVGVLTTFEGRLGRAGRLGVLFDEATFSRSGGTTENAGLVISESQLQILFLSPVIGGPSIPLPPLKVFDTGTIQSQGVNKTVPGEIFDLVPLFVGNTMELRNVDFRLVVAAVDQELELLLEQVGTAQLVLTALTGFPELQLELDGFRIGTETALEGEVSGTLPSPTEVNEFLKEEADILGVIQVQQNAASGAVLRMLTQLSGALLKLQSNTEIIDGFVDSNGVMSIGGEDLLVDIQLPNLSMLGTADVAFTQAGASGQITFEQLDILGFPIDLTEQPTRPMHGSTNGVAVDIADQIDFGFAEVLMSGQAAVNGVFHVSGSKTFSFADPTGLVEVDGEIFVSLNSATGFAGHFEGTASVGGFDLDNLSSTLSESGCLTVSGDVRKLELTGNPPELRFVTRKKIAHLSLAENACDSVSGLVVQAHDGYVAEALVFFDANFNGVRDFQDKNENQLQDPGEWMEPAATTGADGTAVLSMPAVFDIDGDGQFRLDEGQLVVVGGTDLATRLPLQTPLLLPATEGLVGQASPFSTLATHWARMGTLSIDETATALQAALGLSETDPLSHDPWLGLENGEAGSGEMVIANLQLQTTLIQLSQLMRGFEVAPPAAFTAALDALTTKFRDERPVVLGDQTTMEEVVRDLAEGFGLVPQDELVEGVSRVVASVNDALANLRSSLPEAVTHALQIAHVAQSQIGDAVRRLAAGSQTTSAFLAEFTGQRLTDKIHQATVGHSRPPIIELVDPRVRQDKQSAEFQFRIEMSMPSQLDVTVPYAVYDMGADSLVDRQIAEGEVVLSMGATGQEVQVALPELANGQQLRLRLLRPDFATLGRSIVDYTHTISGNGLSLRVEGPRVLTAQQPQDYRLVLENHSSHVASDVRVHLDVPAGIDLSNAEACSLVNAGEYLCVMPAIPPDGTEAITVTATADRVRDNVMLPLVATLMIGVTHELTVHGPADSDGDGIDNAIEALADHQGDGNRDGILDFLQPNVVSLPGVGGGAYVTISSNPGTRLVNVRMLTLIDEPQVDSSSFNAGFVDFEVHDAPSSVIQVRLHGADFANLRTHWWFPSTGDPSRPGYAPFYWDGVVGAARESDSIVLYLQDQSRGDDDGEENNVIVHRGGGVVSPSIWRNPIDSYDVNADGRLTATGDVLPVINELNQPQIVSADFRFPDQWPKENPSSVLFYDVNGDRFLSPVQDVLPLINAMNRLSADGEAALGTAWIAHQNHLTESDKEGYPRTSKPTLIVPAAVFGLPIQKETIADQPLEPRRIDTVMQLADLDAWLRLAALDLQSCWTDSQMQFGS